MAKTNDHYVPQFLLKNFADQSGKVDVFDKWTGNTFKPATRNLASELGYNDYQHEDGRIESFEDTLTAIEYPAVGTIGEILSSKSIACLQDKDRRFTFARFLAIQILRTRMMRNWMEQIDNATATKLESETFNGAPIRRTPQQIQNDSILQLALADDLVPQLLNKQWLLAGVPDGSSYLTSDNPVVRQNIEIDEYRGNSGLASIGIQIFFPLSPLCVLMLVCQSLIEPLRKVPTQIARDVIHAVDTGNCTPAPQESVDYCNSLQVVQSRRFVIGDTRVFPFVRNIIEEFPELKNPQFA